MRAILRSTSLPRSTAPARQSGSRSSLRFPQVVFHRRLLCARAANCPATVPPSSVMNVRRLMRLSLQPTFRATRSYHIRGDACCASQQISAAHVGCGSKGSDRRARRVIGMSAVPPIATEFVHCNDSTKGATSRPEQVQQRGIVIRLPCRHGELNSQGFHVRWPWRF